MAIVKGTITATGQEVDITIPTVKIPELPETTEAIETLDKVPFWDNSQSKTLWVGMQALRDYMVTGGLNTPELPVLFGDSYEIVITQEMEDNNDGVRCDVPALAGDDFILERRGVGQLKTTEFSNLPSGGFIITDGTKLKKDEVFFAKVFSLLGEVGGGGGTTVELLKGIATIGSDTQISSTHFNKLIYFLNNALSPVATLPDIDTAPANLLLIFQTATNVTKQSKIVTKNGQNIYLGEGAVDHVWLGKNQTLWLYNGGDGWYPLNDSHGILDVGDTFFAYKEKMNTLVMKGQIVNRADYPRLWEWVQTLGPSLVSDSLWATSEVIDTTPGTILLRYPYKGCFSTGNGTTTFRLPDSQNMFWRGLNNIGSTDAERQPTSTTLNHPGIIQKDQNRKHNHPNIPVDFYNEGGNGQIASGGNIKEYDNFPLPIDYSGGVEARSVNIGMLPLIKV